MQDRANFELHLRRMQTWYLPTALPGLVQRCQRLARLGSNLLSMSPTSGTFATGEPPQSGVAAERHG
jgi:hypothetical protein